MGRRTTTPATATNAPALLCKPKEDVRSQLLARASLGSNLLNRQVQTREDLKDLSDEFRSWNAFNADLLRRVFSSDQYASEYMSSGGIRVASSHTSFRDEVELISDRIKLKINRLSSIAERLDLVDEMDGVSRVQPPEPANQLMVPGPNANKKVFLVHGQDEEAKAIVARFITGCGLETIILHEQPNGGMTIIEKFEREADVGFAIILMTPDDVGGRRRGSELASETLQPRARQNVILELGYFVGKLGRKRVAALKRGDLEMPSDVAGVVWTPMDAADGWKTSLVRELRSAGYEIDVAKALGV